MQVVIWVAVFGVVLSVLGALVYLVRVGNRVADDIEREFKGE